MSRLHLRRVPLPEVPWEDLDARADRTVFQTRDWLDVLAATQAAEPVVARVHDGGEAVGWFTGAVVRRRGLRLLGSPLPGWTTSYMGFNLDDPLRLLESVMALRRFAFTRLGCVHLELMDRRLPAGPLPGFRESVLPGYELDLRRDDDELLAAMTRNGRRDVRRALRNGITVEDVAPSEHASFASEYFDQVTEAFAKRGRRPTYPASRVTTALRLVRPERLLALRARTPDGEVAATGMFLGLPGGTAVFWMGASSRRLQHLLPNEALMWHALRTWRDRGALRMDFGGGGTYKAKYGGTPISVPWWRTSAVPALEGLRAGVARRSRPEAAAELSGPGT